MVWATLVVRLSMADSKSICRFLFLIQPLSSLVPHSLLSCSVLYLHRVISLPSLSFFLKPRPPILLSALTPLLPLLSPSRPPRSHLPHCIRALPILVFPVPIAWAIPVFIFPITIASRMSLFLSSPSSSHLGRPRSCFLRVGLVMKG